MVSIRPSLAKGIFTMTRYEKEKYEVVSLNKTPSVTPFMGDLVYWRHRPAGITWPSEGDKVIIQSADETGGGYVQCIYNLKQEIDSIAPVSFRVIAQGEGIEADGSDAEQFGIKLQITYNDEGLSGGGTVDEVELPLPRGTWGPKQFEVSFTPTMPVRYIYAYVYARKAAGKLTVWDGEIINGATPQLNRYGTYESEIVDLYKELQLPITTFDPTQKMERFTFEYGELDNIDNMGSLQHSIDFFMKFDGICTDSTLKYSPESRTKDVITALVTAGKKLYGYIYCGSNEDHPLIPFEEHKLYIDEYHSLGYRGIFIDMAGWDYGTTRAEFNERVDYVHSLGMDVIANAWNPIEILSSEPDPTYNPDGTPTSLGEGDWILFEEFYSRQDNQYMDTYYDEARLHAQFQKYFESQEMASQLGIKALTLADVHTNISAETKLKDIKNVQIMSFIFGANGYSYANTKDNTYIEYEEVQFDTPTGKGYLDENGVLIRPTENGIVYMDFSNGRVSGMYSTEAPIEDVKLINMKEGFEGDYTKAEWLTSDDKVNWEPATKSNVKRYVKLFAVLRKY